MYISPKNRKLVLSSLLFSRLHATLPKCDCSRKVGRRCFLSIRFASIQVCSILWVRAPISWSINHRVWFTVSRMKLSSFNLECPLDSSAIKMRPCVQMCRTISRCALAIRYFTIKKRTSCLFYTSLPPNSQIRCLRSLSAVRRTIQFVVFIPDGVCILFPAKLNFQLFLLLRLIRGYRSPSTSFPGYISGAPRSNILWVESVHLRCQLFWIMYVRQCCRSDDTSTTTERPRSYLNRALLLLLQYLFPHKPRTILGIQ